MSKICEVSLKIYKDLPGVRGYIPKKIVKNIIGDHIVIDIKSLEIRRPGIDDTKTLGIRTGQLVLCVDDREEYVGEYNLVQKNEDTFYLKRREDE